MVYCLFDQTISFGKNPLLPYVYDSYLFADVPELCSGRKLFSRLLGFVPQPNLPTWLNQTISFDAIYLPVIVVDFLIF